MFGGASFVEVAPENSLLDCSGLGAIDGGPCITSRFAAPYERSLSVAIRLDSRPSFFNSLTNKRLATLVSRRAWTIPSRT